MNNSGFPLMFQPLARYADFNGRSRRSEYWLWALFMFLLNAALTAVQYGLLGASMASMHGTAGAEAQAGAAGAMGGMMIINLIKFVVFFGLLLPTIAVAVRRMHDVNRTGWWIVFPFSVMVVAMIIVFTLSGADLVQQIRTMSADGKTNDASTIINMVVSIMRVLLWVLIPTLAAKVVTFVFRVTEGTTGNNRFGPDPKGGAPTNVF